MGQEDLHGPCLKSNIKSICSLLIPDSHLFSATVMSVFVSMYACVWVSVLSNCAAPMLAGHCNAGTYPNMNISWLQGQCSCLAHNSDWLEYQWPELNPKQLLTRDIKQSGESSHRDLMMPPGKHVLAHTVVLFNTIASKQLITLSKWASPLSPVRRNWEPND